MWPVGGSLKYIYFLIVLATSVIVLQTILLECVKEHFRDCRNF